jgi:hypothetical protein
MWYTLVQPIVKFSYNKLIYKILTITQIIKKHDLVHNQYLNFIVRC